MIMYFDFGRFHGKDGVQGSTYIRMVQLEKYWPELSKYKYGANPEVLIFQKVYMSPDYSFPKNFEGIKILDICDPDWLDDYAIVETSRHMDAVVCPTQPLVDFISQFHPNVNLVPDRFNVDNLPKPKKHEGKAKTVVWFGYSHNAELLKLAMGRLDELGLNIIIVSQEDPIVDRWSMRDRKDFYTFIKHPQGDDIYKELQKADFAILPEGFRPQDVFKSNNKTVRANLAGLPVARTSEEVDRYMDGKQRQLWVDTNYGLIKEQYDVRRSVEDYKRIIKEIS